MESVTQVRLIIVQILLKFFLGSKENDAQQAPVRWPKEITKLSQAELS